MVKQTLAKSFDSAFEGLMYALATEKNIRLHLLIAAMVLCLGIYLDLKILEIAILLLVIAFVIVTEMLNTAVEIAVNLLGEDEAAIKRRAKNVAAASVLIASLAASIIGYLILIKPFLRLGIGDKISEIKHSPWQITLLSLVIVLFLVIAKKLLFLSKRQIIPLSLEGGMPSGHSAIAFSIWTVIAFLSRDAFIISLAFVLVLLMLQSRVKQTVHNLWEVIVGGVIGTLVTVLIFQLLG